MFLPAQQLGFQCLGFRLSDHALVLIKIEAGMRQHLIGIQLQQPAGLPP